MLQELVVSGRRAGGGATSGGASIGPSFGVVAETSFNLQPNPGKRFDYARADHTHGTPPAPVLAGDVTGPVTSTTVASIRNREVVQTAPAENQVLTFVGGKWRAADPTGGGGSALKPATTVNAETNFALPSSVGVSTDYARADHTHGTPPAPVLAGDVTGATGTTKVVALQNVAVDPTKPTTNGQLLGFDSVNNRWKPVAAPASTLSGDVTGATNISKVVALQNVAVDPTRPTTGQFLGFDAGINSWRPVPPPAAPAAQTNIVTRPTGLPAYSIVAAGTLPGVVGGTNTYNNLRVTTVKDGLVSMLFDGYAQPPTSNPLQQYIVKVMAVLPTSTPLNDLTVAFAGFGDNATGFTLLVNNAGQRVNIATLGGISFMVEVSQYDMKGFGTAKAKEAESKSVKDSDKAIKDVETSSTTTTPAGASPSFLVAGAAVPEARDGDAAPDGRAFIVEDERPQVGRAAFDLADKQDDKLPESGAPEPRTGAVN
jgi:hypothetical protein